MSSIRGDIVFSSKAKINSGTSLFNLSRLYSLLFWSTVRIYGDRVVVSKWILNKETKRDFRFSEILQIHFDRSFPRLFVLTRSGIKVSIKEPIYKVYGTLESQNRNGSLAKPTKVTNLELLYLEIIHRASSRSDAVGQR